MSQDTLIRLQCTECKSFNYHTHRNFKRQDSEKLALKKDPLIFLLWGRSAQEKGKNVFRYLDVSHHLILKAAHPSPLSAYNGFLGCKHFSLANSFLEEREKTPINWQIP